MRTQTDESSKVVVTYDNERHSLSVESADGLKRMRILALAPDFMMELEEEDAQVDCLTDKQFTKLYGWYCEILQQLTELSKSDIDSLDEDLVLKAAPEVLDCAIDGDETKHDSVNDEVRGRRRVVATKQFIERLFKGELGMVCGMPDDVELVDFRYDITTQSLEFVFSSEEWSSVNESATIPEYDDAMALGIEYGTKEL